MNEATVTRAARAATLIGALAAPGAVQALVIEFQENLGNFPDAIAVTAEFGEFTGLEVNGDSITGVGFLFHVANTSYGDGKHAAFEVDPDGSFATSDRLTQAAADAIDAAQPFGIYRFGALLPDGSGVIVSAPDGFELGFGDLRGGNREVNLEIPLKDSLDGLIFDPAAPVVPAIFTSPRLGTYDFFISTPDGLGLDQILALQPSPEGIDIATRLAWEEGLQLDADGAATVSDPLLLNRRLRPRGQLNAQLPALPQAAPEPGALALTGLGLAGIWAARRRRRA